MLDVVGSNPIARSRERDRRPVGPWFSRPIRFRRVSLPPESPLEGLGCCAPNRVGDVRVVLGHRLGGVPRDRVQDDLAAKDDPPVAYSGERGPPRWDGCGVLGDPVSGARSVN